MRRTALLFLLIALCITAAPVRAQTSVHVRGGAALPLSPNVFTETAAPSLTLEAGPAFALTDRLRLIATVGHHRFSLDGPFLSDPEALTVWSLAADYGFSCGRQPPPWCPSSPWARARTG